MTSMAKLVDKRFAWVINFSSLQHESCYSAPVLISGIKWRLSANARMAYHGDPLSLSLYLEAVDWDSLPNGWRIYTKYSLSIENQRFSHLSIHTEGTLWFDKEFPIWCFPYMYPLFNLGDINSGFLVNGEFLVIAEIEVIEVIDTLSASQVTEISDNTEHRGLDYSSSSEDIQTKDDVTVEVNGFQVLESQVSQVKAIIEKHPDLTSNLNLENQQIKNAYMYALLDLIKTMSKSPKEITVEELNKADSTLSHLIKVGLNLKWLCQKMDRALEKQLAYDTRIKELEKQVKKGKLALAELEADLEKEKAAALAETMLFDWNSK